MANPLHYENAGDDGGDDAAVRLADVFELKTGAGARNMKQISGSAANRARPAAFAALARR
jgi:hypothetical protein